MYKVEEKTELVLWMLLSVLAYYIFRFSIKAVLKKLVFGINLLLI